MLDRMADLGARAAGDLEAESVLQDLASVFFESTASYSSRGNDPDVKARQLAETPLPNLEAKYRALVEQIPAVVFMAYLDERIGETYVSPQIETVLGFTQEEWLQDPVRWYQQVHPDDKQRWSVEAAQLFLSGEPLRSAYRVLARDGRVIWFHCEAKMIRREDGRPWFIHGVGFDITDLKKTEEALQEERNVVIRDPRYRGRAGGRARSLPDASSASTGPANKHRDMPSRRYATSTCGSCSP